MGILSLFRYNYKKSSESADASKSMKAIAASAHPTSEKSKGLSSLFSTEKTSVKKSDTLANIFAIWRLIIGFFSKTFAKFSGSSSLLSFQIAFVDFLEHVLQIIFTITTKLVFLVRDILINTLGILYSICLIPLDFILIIAHSTLLHFVYRILDNKRTKLAEGESLKAGGEMVGKENGKDNQITATDLVLARAAVREKRYSQWQQKELGNLATTRSLFWSGQPLSIRAAFMDYFQMSNNNSNENQVIDDHPLVQESVMILAQEEDQEESLNQRKITSEFNSFPKNETLVENVLTDGNESQVDSLNHPNGISETSSQPVQNQILYPAQTPYYTAISNDRSISRQINNSSSIPS